MAALSTKNSAVSWPLSVWESQPCAIHELQPLSVSYTFSRSLLHPPASSSLYVAMRTRSALFNGLETADASPEWYVPANTPRGLTQRRPVSIAYAEQCSHPRLAQQSSHRRVAISSTASCSRPWRKWKRSRREQESEVDWGLAVRYVGAAVRAGPRS